ncbi:hypothetical protein ACFORL_02895 [Legionella dresdenensis]|uniref:Uncharacterized protein n=1 Tax=Legionella dresdenensis TaxID=450200 RepID=A0ABV8CDC2_9GAMM
MITFKAGNRFVPDNFFVLHAGWVVLTQHYQFPLNFWLGVLDKKLVGSNDPTYKNCLCKTAICPSDPTFPVLQANIFSNKK